MLETAMLIVSLMTLALCAWAFVDCLRRPVAAFPAVERQTKVAWLLFTGLALLVQVAPWIGIGLGGSIGLLGLAAVVVAVYYLVDVRTKVLAITRR